MAKQSNLAKALTQFTIPVEETAEEAVSELFNEVLGVRPVFHTDVKSGKTNALLFSENSLVWARRQIPTIRKRLEAIHEIGLLSHVPRISVSGLKPANWAESWKEHFPPLSIGQKLLIRPTWSKQRPLKGQAVVELDPGLSFGTGQHPTTSFCLRQIADLSEEGKAYSLLDMGTGSGILAIAAAKLGMQPIKAFDNYPDAVRISKENAELNGVLEDIAFSRQDLSRLSASPRKRYDIVCANLIYDVILDYWDIISGHVKIGGHLIAAGILAEQFDRVRKALESEGLELRVRGLENEWESGLFIKIR